MKSIIKFFLSIKTAYGFLLFFVAVLFYGAFSLPNNLAFFSGIDDEPLFSWLANAKGPGITWWIYALIAGFSLFAVNTIFCTGDALLFRLNRRDLIAKLSPQVMHAGVLFVMMGHLLTASLGTRLDIDIKKGAVGKIAEQVMLSLEDVKETMDGNGYTVDWDARIRWIEDGKSSAVSSLRPAHPLYFGAYGIYTRSVSNDRNGPSALIRVSRDPGALPALFGGILLTLGGVGFLYGRFSPKTALDTD